MVILSRDGLSAYCCFCQRWRNFYPDYTLGTGTAVPHRFYDCGHMVERQSWMHYVKLEVMGDA